jgi:hypothetical protein
MYNFITLFDKNYFSRGLALYNSLVKHCDNFILYILAMDQETEDLLNKEKLNKISIIQLSQIEAFYAELTELKKIRSRAEYCWTLTPYSIQYAIKKNNLDSCTYLDSDIYFFNDPKILFDEAGSNSIIITEHRYTPICDQTGISGKYCVQFVFFKNDNNGMEALEWWRQRCREWCYSKCEDGKFGDQKYLDDWTTRFKGVYVPAHIGCGLAPWNIQQYNITNENDKLYLQDKITKKKEHIIFYHFHGLKKLYADANKIIWFLSPDKRYVIDINARELIYADYIRFHSKYEEASYGSLKKIEKPSLSSVFYFIIKDIIRSLLIFRKFRYYREQLNHEYNDNKIKYYTVNR